MNFVVNYSWKNFPKIEGYYRSTLKIKQDGLESDIAIYANQPVSPTGNLEGIELVPKDLAERMGYSKFKFKKIIYSDIHSSSSFARDFEKILYKLENH